MNVPPDALHELAVLSGCPLSHTGEGVVRFAAEKLRDLRQHPEQQRLFAAAKRALRALTDPNDNDYHEAVEMLRTALKPR